jgi:chromate transporter
LEFAMVLGGFFRERQFVDAIAAAMITPGPVVITAGFIGYLVAGIVGAVAAALAVFAPPYFFVLAGAPYSRRFASVQRVRAFVHGCNGCRGRSNRRSCFCLGTPWLVDPVTWLTAMVTFTVLTLIRKVPEPIMILAAGIVGVVMRGDVR